MRFEVLRAITMENNMFRVVTPCSQLDVHRILVATCSTIIFVSCEVSLYLLLGPLNMEAVHYSETLVHFLHTIRRHI